MIFLNETLNGQLRSEIDSRLNGSVVSENASAETGSCLETTAFLRFPDFMTLYNIEG